VTERDLYREAGVNIDAGNEAAKRYGQFAKRTQRAGVLGTIGGFAGGFALDLQKYPNPVLLSGTDGVGTKLKIAFATNRHDTIGIDCVAMCVNDILTSGAEPLFFLDYLAVGALDVDVAEAVVRGIADGCAQAGCALIGGETAEMPSMYQNGEYDVAGFAVGVVNQPDIIDGRHVSAGDVVLGLASNGIHSNGLSLVRQLVAQAGLDFADTVPGWRGTVADELLQPTRIYVKSIQALLASGAKVRAMAHITGGGLLENIPRVLPDGFDAVLSTRAWPLPSVYEWLLAQSGMSFLEAARIWNLGIGYVVVVPREQAETAASVLKAAGETVFAIGTIAPGQQTVVLQDR